MSFCALIRRRTILMVKTTVQASCNAGWSFTWYKIIIEGDQEMHAEKRELEILFFF